MNKIVVTLLCLLLVALFSVAKSLEADDYEEGVCLHNIKPDPNFNSTWWASIDQHYVLGGSKYHLYRIASNHPQFLKMREFDFYYDACLQVNTRTGLVSGFGGEIGNVVVKPTGHKAVFDFILYPNPGTLDICPHTITLTDNKSFVVFVNCWSGSNQRAWDVLSTTPTLDRKTQKLIEDHVGSLGFERENFVFLRYDSCRTNSHVVPGNYNNIRAPFEKQTASPGWQAVRVINRGNRIW